MKSQFADDPVVASLLPGFLANLHPLLEQVAAAANQGNLNEAGRIAHTVRGSSACYGYQDISHIMANIEKSCAGPESQSMREDELQDNIKKAVNLVFAAQKEISA